MKKILFLTATRAEFGKMKTLMKEIENHKNFELFVFVTGMHMLRKYGYTLLEIKSMNFKNIYAKRNQYFKNNMNITFSKTVKIFSKYVEKLQPDLIVIHGDRLEALAGAVVGAFLNIKVAHIEGGEISGTIDESIRHAITKFSHIHLVSNEDAKNRIIQLGEKSESIHIIGSPDIDVMLSKTLPDIRTVKNHYEINFEKYAVMSYHPVVSEISQLKNEIRDIVDSLIESEKNYVVIWPNNDTGTEIIQQEYEKLRNNPKFRVFPSIRFEMYLSLLKNASFMIGNSSAGIRETGIYGIPSIDIGSRQSGRYNSKKSDNIFHVNANKNDILSIIKSMETLKNIKKTNVFGDGKSTEKFLDFIENENFWNTPTQKKFVDLES